MSKIQRSFYLDDDVEALARRLLGLILCTRMDEGLTRGRIVETEAYAGVSDRASHAHGGRRTRRTEIMYLPGGHAYVYLIYGIHHLFNVVTNVADVPHAVLIRAVQPVEGMEIMAARRRHPRNPCKLTAGPGLLSQALGITTRDSGIDLTGERIWLEEAAEPLPERDIARGPRIGVDYAGADARLHRRFWIRDNPWVSRKK